jgi:GAF domain-containing protein
MLEKTERTVSELSSLMRMLQVLPEADSIARIYLMLLAFCTTWRTIGFQRAYLLLVDPKQKAARGHLAAEQIPLSENDNKDWRARSSFEVMAKTVFKNYEQIESSDLTLKTRTFNVPLDWHRSAVVKAIASEYPVMAEGRLSEFATDPFLDFFGTNSYIAVPVKVHGRVVAVLAADNGMTDQRITVDDVSLVFSLTQHAALAVERLLDTADQKRKSRVLRKLQEMLNSADTRDRINESLNLALSMICRSVGGSGVFLKDMVRHKTLHIKAVDEFTVEADDTDMSIGECFETILDRATGIMKTVRGDSEHALLSGIAAETVRYFLACPLAAAGEGQGALAVYVEKDETNRKHDRFKVKDKVFVELCAGLIADKLRAVQINARLERSEDILEEVRSNLAREQESSKVGARVLEYYQQLEQEVDVLEKVIRSRVTYQKRIEQAKNLLEEMGREVSERRREINSMKFSLRMTDLFKVVGKAVAPWKEKAQANGVEVTVRIPSRGPTLLMNEGKIHLALDSILRTLTSCVKEGDKVMVECSTNDDRAMVAIADTGAGLPGNLLSRLFMPFSDLDQDDEFKSAMSLAGDILHRHSGEIMVRSSGSWKTILVVNFPLVANKDRRRSRVERRRHHDRRTPTPPRRPTKPIPER